MSEIKSLEDLLTVPAKQEKEASNTLKADTQELVFDAKTGIASLIATFDLNKVITEGKSTTSGKEKYANLTLRCDDVSRVRFSGNLFVRVV